MIGWIKPSETDAIRRRPGRGPVPDKPPFEIWPTLHELTEKNVEQARSAYGQLLDFMTKAMVAPLIIAPFPGLRAV